MSNFIGAAATSTFNTITDLSNINSKQYAGQFNTPRGGRNKEIIVPTLLSASATEVNFWSNLTCFYDKHWEYDPNYATSPISFIAVKKVTEVVQANTNSRRVILYESPLTTGTQETVSGYIGTHPAYTNNMRSIVDNVVVEPKEYQIECIVSNSLYGHQIRQGINRLKAMINFMADTYTDNVVTTTLDYMVKAVQVTMNLLDSYNSLYDTIAGATDSDRELSRLNKNSLLAMAQSGHPLLLKKWTGMNYSYGIITNINITSEAKYQDSYAATITLKEVPVLNISVKELDKSTSGYTDNISTLLAVGEKVNLGLAVPFLKMTGVVDEAGAPGTDSPNGNYNVSDILAGW